MGVGGGLHRANGGVGGGLHRANGGGEVSTGLMGVGRSPQSKWG